MGYPTATARGFQDGLIIFTLTALLGLANATQLFGRLDIPKLSVIFGLTTLVIGSTVGVTVQIILGTGNQLPTTTDLIGAHAAAQVGGYLILVAAGVIEWQLTGGGKRTAAGLVQV